MKLPERFQFRTSERDDEALDPEIEAQLAAIDAALAGGPVPADAEGMAQLTRELRAERAEPDPAFAAKLDEWAANGFERGERPGDAALAARRVASRSERLRARIAGLTPRKLAPAGAAVTFIVVVGVAISQGGLESGGTDESLDSGDSVIQDAPSDDAGGFAAPQSESEDDTGAAVSSAERTPGNDAEALSGDLGDGDVQRYIENARRATANAKSAQPRRIAQTADLVLATEPDGVRQVADDVNRVVNTYNGFVIASSVSSGDGDRGNLGAQFRMKIPARSLQPALADLSELAHVRSRTEGTDDITGRFISAQERIEENEAARESLLKQLADAVTEEERAAIEAQIRAVNNQLSIAREDLAQAEQRVQLVPVTVSIVAEEGADEDGEWSIGDALDDAGDVLSTTAGILVVAGAVLLPLALVGLIFAVALRTRANRGRERALDE